MKHAAFTLIELSMVLVILGLLIGGVLSGRSLIRASELRSVTADYNKYQTSINAFRSKYNALPGDMTNATNYWGAANADPTTCKTTLGTGTQTCNGDGNGQISQILSDSSKDYEMFRAWQQLAIAGLIEGAYSGIAGAGGSNNSIIFNNVPASKITGAGFTLLYVGPYAGDSSWFNDNYKHIIEFGAQDTTYGTLRPVLYPEDAFNIDSKIDDGKPGTGQVMSFKSTSGYWPGGCSTTTDPVTSVYAISSTTVLCSLIFKLGF